MKKNQTSFTAMIVAYMRAYHLIYDEKRALIEQFLTEHYLTCNKGLDNLDHAGLLFDQVITSTFLKQTINGIIGRARYAEDTLEKAIKQGVKQYVILGAGMDTFAFRRPDLMDTLKYLKSTIQPHKNLSFIALSNWDGNFQQNYTSFQ
jgi:O-methyltransferase involved in polyketide biosynthesis